MDFIQQLKSMQKTSIRINYISDSKAECPIGASKVGGKPDLPPGFQWFYYYGKGVFDDDISANRPLSFLAQINCGEIHKYDKDSLLPSAGMLYFFYEMETMPSGIYPGDKGGARVHYYPGDVSNLQRTDFPLELPAGLILPEMHISFSAEISVPDFEEFRVWHEEYLYDNWMEFNKFKMEMCGEPPEDRPNMTKLLGYANLIQGHMLYDCEKVSKGYKLDALMTTEESKQMDEGCKKWQMLFQFDSISTDEYELLWGDSGSLYFYVPAGDLAKQSFDNCWTVLQCY